MAWFVLNFAFGMEAVTIASAGLECELSAAIELLEAEVAARKRLARVVDEQARILAKAVDGIARIDAEGRFTEMSEAFAALLGHRKETLVGRVWMTIVHPEDHEAALAARAACRDEATARVELRGVRGDASVVEIELTLLAIEPDLPSGAHCCVLRDLSGRRPAEAHLQETSEAAEAANRARGAFVASISHEIRTPLNGIIGMTELALETRLSTEQRGYLETILASAESLGELINDILDFSKVEARKLDLEAVPFDLRETLDETMRALALRAHQKGLELACDVAPEVPDMLVGDAGRLRQIVTNLVGNAIKFTDQGEVVVRVARTSAAADHVDLRFVVADTGVGIAPERQHAIFEPFTQADASVARRHGGTGLGLAISRQLVEMMGGEIWLESAAGRGSSFHFSARFGAAAPAGAAFPPLPGGLDGVRVLVADDNETQRRIIADLLRSWHMEPVTVGSGRAALGAHARARREGKPFALVVVDARMPEMDGFTVVERMRALGGTMPASIMLLTPTAPGIDRARCNALAVATTLTKPIRASDLLDAILVALGERRTGAPAPIAERVARVGPPRRVLLVEDNPVNQTLVRALLGKHGHAIVVAADGRAALAALEREPFDLVLMDVQMPGMDGLTAAAEIRRRERGSDRHVPIVAMTARAMQGDRERCLAAGMDDYLAKPIHAGALLDVVARLGADGAGVAAASAAPDAAGAVADAAGAEVIDRARIRDFVEDDPVMLEAVVTGFLEHGPEVLAEVRTAIARRDRAALGNAAHVLKGSAGFLGARLVVDLARALETSAGRDDWSAVERATDALGRELDRVGAALADVHVVAPVRELGAVDARV